MIEKVIIRDITWEDLPVYCHGCGAPSQKYSGRYATVGDKIYCHPCRHCIICHNVLPESRMGRAGGFHFHQRPWDLKRHQKDRKFPTCETCHKKAVEDNRANPWESLDPRALKGRNRNSILALSREGHLADMFVRAERNLGPGNGIRRFVEFATFEDNGIALGLGTVKTINGKDIYFLEKVRYRRLRFSSYSRSRRHVLRGFDLLYTRGQYYVTLYKKGGRKNRRHCGPWGSGRAEPGGWVLEYPDYETRFEICKVDIAQNNRKRIHNPVNMLHDCEARIPFEANQ